MDKSSKKQQIIASTQGSSSKAAAAAASSKQVAEVNTELVKINRTLAQLEVELVICRRQINDNLKRREYLIQQICLLISTLEKTLMYYDQAENARLKLEETLGRTFFDFSDVDSETDEERQEIIEEIHEMHEDVVRAERQVVMIRKMCAQIEPHLNSQKIENETIHESLCENLEKIERSRHEFIARRRQLLKKRNTANADK